MLSQERIKYRGIKPTDLSVEQPTKFKFIINLKAAKQIGLTIPECAGAGGQSYKMTFSIADFRFWIGETE
jgi:ABC-type uncharacterized transport system substrate-binding protein